MTARTLTPGGRELLPVWGWVSMRAKASKEATSIPSIGVSGARTAFTRARFSARPMIPPRLYTALGELGWRQQAWRNGVYRQLGAKPYTDAA